MSIGKQIEPSGKSYLSHLSVFKGSVDMQFIAENYELP